MADDMLSEVFRTAEGDEAVMAWWRVLTVRQPWASCIVPGGKEIENRSHAAVRWSWRGAIAIHAGAGWSDRGAHDPRVRAFYNVPGINRGGMRHALELGHASTRRVTRPPDPFPSSAIVSIAIVDDIHTARGCHRPWGEDQYVRADGKVENDVAHLHLVHIVKLPEPIEYRHGGLGLRRPSLDLAYKLTDFAGSIEWDGMLWPR